MCAEKATYWATTVRLLRAQKLRWQMQPVFEMLLVHDSALSTKSMLALLQQLDAALIQAMFGLRRGAASVLKEASTT